MVACEAVRILLDYRPALRARTGVGEFAHELAKALGQLQPDRVSALSTSWRDRVSPEAARELDGVRIVDVRIPMRGLAWTWNRLRFPPVEWLAGDADVVHSLTPLIIPSRNAASVVTIHDLDFLRHPERTEAEMRRDFPVLVREHAHRADQIVVPSRYVAREVSARLGVDTGRISVCSLGAPEWAPPIARARVEGPVADSCILFLGTLEPRKNIGGLLDAYTRLRALRQDAPELVLAGHARTSMASELERITKAPLAGHVSLTGYVSEGKRRELYRRAAMLVLPSLEEGFGLPVLEAMACGVPVVVSNRGSLPEVAGDAASPVEATDSAAIAEEMSRLLDDDAARRAAARGLTRAAAYSWDACAASAFEAYRAAIAHRAGRSVAAARSAGTTR